MWIEYGITGWEAIGESIGSDESDQEVSEHQWCHNTINYYGMQ